MLTDYEGELHVRGETVRWLKYTTAGAGRKPVHREAANLPHGCALLPLLALSSGAASAPAPCWPRLRLGASNLRYLPRDSVATHY